MTWLVGALMSLRSLIFSLKARVRRSWRFIGFTTTLLRARPLRPPKKKNLYFGIIFATSTIDHFPSASNFRERSSPTGSPMAGLQKSYGQRSPQTSPCRNASLQKNGGFHSSVPCTSPRDGRVALAPGMATQQTGEMLKQPSSGSFGASKAPLESSRDALH